MSAVKSNRDMKFLLSDTEEDIGKKKVKHEWFPSGKRLPPFCVFDEMHDANEDAMRIQSFSMHREVFGEPRGDLPPHLTAEELREMNFSEVSVTDEFYEQQVRRISEEINQEVQNLTRRYSHRSGHIQFVGELEQVLNGYLALGSLAHYSIEEREGFDTLMDTRHAHLTINLQIPRGTRTERVSMGVIL